MKKKLSFYLDYFIVVSACLVILSWIIGNGPFHIENRPSMSIFTALSLFIMSSIRIAEQSIETWSKSMSLAMLGIVIGGNLSSIIIHVLVPKLFFLSMSDVVPTSNMTSIGLILFCLYQMLILFRSTPKSIIIIDDLLLHLALAPGGVSLLGFVMNNPIYISSSIDTRVGISLLEMGFMGCFATASVLWNPNLFMWEFLRKRNTNKFIFILLFANQFIAPIIIGNIIKNPRPNSIGIELFVLLAGTMATFAFLIFQAWKNIQLNPEKI